MGLKIPTIPGKIEMLHSGKFAYQSTSTERENGSGVIRRHSSWVLSSAVRSALCSWQWGFSCLPLA